METRSLYVHIPFCESICSYCDFCKVYYDQKQSDLYLQRLNEELSQIEQHHLKTIYIGGGTPSALNDEQLEKLMSMLKTYSLEVEEYCMEVNPESMDYYKLKILKKGGINRLSIGVQTFQDHLLKEIDRHHNTTQVKNIIEGILYLKGDEGIDIKELSLILEISKKEAVEAMDHFIEAYSKRGFDGLQVVDFGGKYKLATNPQYFPYYQKMVEQSKTTLSQAALETLAIIAYNQPITRAKVEDIRGVGCDGMIRKLIAKALIKEVGREESPGLPILYGVTNEFMDAFSLASLDELPELGDIVETESDEDIFATRYQEGDLSETD